MPARPKKPKNAPRKPPRRTLSILKSYTGASISSGEAAFFALLSKQAKALVDSFSKYILSFELEKSHEWFQHPDGLLAEANASLETLLCTFDKRGSGSSEVLSILSRDTAQSMSDSVQAIIPDTLPTYATFYDYYPDIERKPEDLAKALRLAFGKARGRYLETFNTWVKDKPTPAQFSSRAGWYEMQSSDRGIRCHQPGHLRPFIPLKILHPAFKLFSSLERHTYTYHQLRPFRAAAFSMATILTSDEESGLERAQGILKALETIFPTSEDFEWTFDKGSRKRNAGKLNSRTRILCRRRGVLLLLIVFKIESATSGDPYMVLCRSFDAQVDADIRMRNTGAATFLIAMAGPYVKFCGGWADQTNLPPAIDVFESLFVRLDVAHDSREDLAQTLCRLKRAVALLPSSYIPLPGSSAVLGVPAIFNRYTHEDTNLEHPLNVLSRLPADVLHTVFFAHATGLGDQLPIDCPNCVARLVYGGRYGYDVHLALAPDYAPRFLGISSSEVGASLVIMEYLAPPSEKEPGWIPLSELLNSAIEIDSSLSLAISDSLDGLLHALGRGKFVHGDLRASNIMIAMADLFHLQIPVKIKAVDFEWAGAVDEAYYSASRLANIELPGLPGELILTSHDQEMMSRLKLVISSRLSKTST